jgi:colanic acid biosynthesis glycosyl transferase WcaI
MKALVVSQYYWPEVGATQNRLRAFVDHLLARGHEVSVICEQPNHPRGVFDEGYGNGLLRRERSGPLALKRVWVYASPKKTTSRRMLFYGTFSAAAAAVVAALPRPDVVLASSPPLPGTLSVGAVARLRRIPLVVDVRDLWPAAAEALGELSNGPLIRAFEHAERWLYRSAAAVTATTHPFCRHIDAVAGRPTSRYVPNGALDDLVALPRRPSPSRDVFRVGYFGNFGIAQGLDVVLAAAKAVSERPIDFVLTGGGPLYTHLAAQVSQRGLTNVTLRPSVPPEHVGSAMQDCDALLVPLRDHPILADFIPSKLYDAMAVGRPTIVVAGGEAAALVAAHDCGIAVPSGDATALADAIARLAGDPLLAQRLGDAGKAAAPQHARSRHADRLCELLEAVAANGAGALPQEVWA